MENEIIGIGTEIKLNINIPSIAGLTMDDYDFIVDVYCSKRHGLTIAKSEAIREDANNYIIIVDTALIGKGTIKCRVEAYIPDGDFEDNIRTEVAFVETGITIIKSI